MGALFHISEDPAIARFEPRMADGGVPLVWAIDEAHVAHYLLPRDCPRVCFRAGPAALPEDCARLLGPTAARAVVAIELAWLARAASATLYCYTMPPEGFALRDVVAGYYVSAMPAVPLAVRRIDDALAELLGHGVELRATPSLWPLCDAVVASSLDFSCIRMRNAQPRGEGLGA